MKDFLGNEIFVGDNVVAIKLHYRELIKATVIKNTDKMCFLEGLDNKQTFKQYYNQLIKINQ